MAPPPSRRVGGRSQLLKTSNGTGRIKTALPESVEKTPALLGVRAHPQGIRGNTG